MTDLAQLIAKIMNNVEYDTNGGCWLWSGAVRNDELRGAIYHPDSRKTESAYRVSYGAFVGPIPPKMLVCHSCDVPACVNPAHLFLGDNSENMRDASRKRRLWSQVNRSEARERVKVALEARNKTWFGSRVPTSRLTEADVREVRASSLTTAELARQFRVSETSIYKIRARKSWKHI